MDQVHSAPRQDKAQKAKLIYLYPPHLVEVADGHRGKVNFIERSGGRAGGDDWGLLKEFFLLQNTLNILKYLKVVFFEKIPHVVPSKADTGEHQLK